MSIFGAFDVPAGAFALAGTLSTVPQAVIEVERVVATERALTPYFWVSDVEHDDFEQALTDDPTVERYTCLDEFEEEIHEAETPEPEHEEMQRLALEKLQAVRHETDAGWWIDTRDDYNFSRRRVLKPAKKAHQRGERAWEDVKAFVHGEVEGDPVDLGPADLMDLCEAWQERTSANAERAERVVECALFGPPEQWQHVGPFA